MAKKLCFSAIEGVVSIWVIRWLNFGSWKVNWMVWTHKEKINFVESNWDSRDFSRKCVSNDLESLNIKD